jgi:DNA/RNA endonuclease G (NUC1)
MVAIPDAFFKIVVREGDGGEVEVLAFNYPQRGVGYRVKKPETYNHIPYLTNVDAIEHFTGLDFLTALSDEMESEVEKKTAVELWELP